MARALSNKALAVLTLMRAEGREMPGQEIADRLMQTTPCVHCSGAGEKDGKKCLACYGRGLTYFSYSMAYIALRQLESRGLVSRRATLDEWGDATRKLVWSVTERPESDDPLEVLYRSPAADRDG